MGGGRRPVLAPTEKANGGASLRSVARRPEAAGGGTSGWLVKWTGGGAGASWLLAAARPNGRSRAPERSGMD